MKRLTSRILTLLLALICVQIALADPALGQRRRERDNDERDEERREETRSDPVYDLGLNLQDPDLADAMLLLEAGKADDAITKLKELLKGSKSDELRRDELNLGLAIVYIRSGQVGAARKQVDAISRRSGDAESTLQAQVLLAVAAKYTSKEAPLRSESAWNGGLMETRRSLAREMDAEGVSLKKSVQSEDWKKCEKKLDDARTLLKRIKVIYLADETPADEDVESKLARAVAEANLEAVEAAERHIERARNYADKANNPRTDNRGRQTRDYASENNYKREREAVQRINETLSKLFNAHRDLTGGPRNRNERHNERIRESVEVPEPLNTLGPR